MSHHLKTRAMKKITLSMVMITIAISVIAQTPQAFKYQAVARDNAGNVLDNRNVSFRIGILQGSASGTLIYSETHLGTTNEFGLVSLEVGNGTEVSGVFEEIDWGNGLYFLKIEMDENGETNYQLMGTSQLLSVPFSLFSESSADAFWEKSGTDIFYDQGNIGVGTNNPTVPLEVNAIFRIVPSGIPDICGPDATGSIFFDELLNEFCYCDGISWKQIDGGGEAGCADNDFDNYDVCDPSHPNDTDGLPADCDDNDPTVYPSANELCDGLDNDCNDLIDEAFPELGALCISGTGACQSGGYFVCNSARDGVECNATPGDPTLEICNGIDDDCDGSVDEDLVPPINPNQEGVCQGSYMICTGEGVWVVDYSGIPEYEVVEMTCDGLDNNCNGEIDEDFPGLGAFCVVGTGTCQSGGYFVCNTEGTGVECNAEPGIPTTEVCNGIDDDCDGVVDDNAIDMVLCYLDNDGDGWGDEMSTTMACQPPDGYSFLAGDCDDQDPDVYPGATEICDDGIDNNCNGLIDGEDPECQ